MREIKARAYEPVNKVMFFYNEIDGRETMQFYFDGGIVKAQVVVMPEDESSFELQYFQCEVMEYTDHQIGGIDLYESDIVRVEEDAEGVDPDDKMNWYVVTWIKEWCMFSLLRISDEYQEYINKGADGLDTTMFWTFPLDVEDIGFSKHFLCGNIYDNPELLSIDKEIKRLQ